MWRIPEFGVSGVKGRQKPPRKAEMLKMNKSERGHQHPVSIKVELLHHSMSGITLQWPFPLKRQVEGKSLSKISTENNRAGVGSSSFLICHRALHSARTTLLHWQPVSDTTLAMCNILLYFNYSNRWMQHTVTKSQTDCNDAWMWACSVMEIHCTRSLSSPSATLTINSFLNSTFVQLKSMCVHQPPLLSTDLFAVHQLLRPFPPSPLWPALH